MNRLGPIVACALAVVAVQVQSSELETPLHDVIDQMVDAAVLGPVAPAAPDAAFARRAYLDLTGTIPTPAEAEAFLQDTSEHKRRDLVDRLLASPRYARHWANVFDVMLMERRGSGDIKPDRWQAFLVTAFAANAPYDELVRQILSADGTEQQHRPAAAFYLGRQADHHVLTRDIGRIFFGRDLQCAQCHDHPLIDDYFQSEYYGLLAFLNRTSLFTGKQEPKQTVLAEKAEGQVTFKSVFIPDSQWTTGPRLPGGQPIDEPNYSEDEAYLVKPDKDVRAVPRHSRRMQLAQRVHEPDAFSSNIVNRLWSHMMGRGLVEPLDLHHGSNLPTHPPLLQVMSNRFVQMGYDIKALLRELALTRTYQRSIEMDGQLQHQIDRAGDRLAQVESQQQRVTDALVASKKVMLEHREQLVAAGKTESEAGRKLSEARDARLALQKSIQEHQSLHEQMTASTKHAERVAEAAKAAGEASEQRPKDKGLAKAAGTLTARACQFEAEAGELAGKVKEQETAATKAAAALPEAEKTCEAAEAALAAAKAVAEQARADHASAQTNYQAHAAPKQEIQRRVDQIRQFTNYANLRASVQKARVRVGQTMSELRLAAEEADAAGSMLRDLQATLAEAMARFDRSSTTLATAQAEGQVRQEQLEALADASDRAQAALGLLPGDPQLQLVADTLEARTVQLRDELAPLEQEIVSCRQETLTASVKAQDAQAPVDAAAARCDVLAERTRQLEDQTDRFAEHLVADKTAADAAYERIQSMWAVELAIGSLKPLSPEQLAWSLMQALGIVERHREQARAELAEAAAKDTSEAVPGGTADEQDPVGREHEAALQLEQAVYDRLKKDMLAFTRLFAPGSGQPQRDFFATVDQALYFANGSQVRIWLDPAEGTLIERLTTIKETEQLARQLYLAALTRWPRPDEIGQVQRYVAMRPDDRDEAIKELVWALLTSTEFRFNH